MELSEKSSMVNSGKTKRQRMGTQRFSIILMQILNTMISQTRCPMFKTQTMTLSRCSKDKLGRDQTKISWVQELGMSTGHVGNMSGCHTSRSMICLRAQLEGYQTWISVLFWRISQKKEGSGDLLEFGQRIDGSGTLSSLQLKWSGLLWLASMTLWDQMPLNTALSKLV